MAPNSVSSSNVCIFFSDVYKTVCFSELQVSLCRKICRKVHCTIMHNKPLHGSNCAWLCRRSKHTTRKLHAQNRMFENGMSARHARTHFSSREHRILYTFDSNAKYRKLFFVCFNLWHGHAQLEPWRGLFISNLLRDGNVYFTSKSAQSIFQNVPH